MNLFKWLVLISLVFSIFTTVYTLLRHNAPKARYFAFVALSVSIYITGYWLEINAPSFDAAYYAVIIEYLGVPYIAPWFFLFILDLHSVKIRRWYYLLFAYPLLETLLVATWSVNGIFYSGATFMQGPPISYLQVSTTLFHRLAIFYLFGMMLVCLVAELRFIRKAEPAGRRKDHLILAAMVCPFIGLVLYGLGIFPIDVTPVGMVITMVLAFYSIFRFNLLDLLPLAKDQMLEQMKDPYLVVDNQWRFFDANAQAKALFPVLETAGYGASLLQASPDIAAIKAATEDNGELVLERDGAERYYRPSITRVAKKGQDVCYCILLYEITDTWQLMDELQQMASFDDLTGVHNRGTFLKLAQFAFEAARSAGTPMAVMMFDLDLFKDVNDSYGHPCGDVVLKEVAQRLKNRLRQGDVFGRYGGEEFCACLPNVQRDSAASVAESLRSVVESTPIYCGDVAINITVSIGVCILDRETHTNLEALLADADKALYQAKEDGRNRVRLCQAMQAQPAVVAAKGRAVP